MTLTTLMYSCKLCGLHRVKVPVRSRETEESVTAWMDHTIHMIAFDHRRRSPVCQAKEITEVMIPLTGTDRIGGPVQN